MKARESEKKTRYQTLSFDGRYGGESRKNKQLLHNAKLELKKSKRKDYYKILGVPKTAVEDEMKKAYRKRALLHHPDRHSNATDEKKKEEEKKFKEMTGALHGARVGTKPPGPQGYDARIAPVSTFPVSH